MEVETIIVDAEPDTFTVPVDIGGMEWVITRESVTTWNTRFVIRSSTKDTSAASYWGGGYTRPAPGKKRYVVPAF